MTIIPDLTELTEKATATLREHFASDITLHEPILVKDQSRSLVVRCRVAGSQAIMPAADSVILKYLRDDAARGFSDWASLAFLSKLPAVHGLIPHFLAGDAEARIFILEDLGGSTSLEDVLTTSDANRAKAILRSLPRVAA